jgi:hypothetical protein
LLQITLEEQAATRDVRERELGAVRGVAVALAVTQIAEIME